MINLANSVQFTTDEVWNCGYIMYKLENESYADFIDVDSVGRVYVDPMSSGAWMDTHDITFLAYFVDIDPDSRVTLPLVDVTLRIQLILPTLTD